MKFILAFAAANAIKLSHKTAHKTTASVVSRARQSPFDYEDPSWLSADPGCAALQGFTWASYVLADANEDWALTVDEFNDAANEISAATAGDVESVFGMISSNGDTDASSISMDDLEVTCA